MAEVNWDDEIYKAENSPRAVLADFLEHADDYYALVIAAVKRDAVDTDSFAWDSSGSAITCIGLATIMLDDLRRGSERPA